MSPRERRVRVWEINCVRRFRVQHTIRTPRSCPAVIPILDMARLRIYAPLIVKHVDGDDNNDDDDDDEPATFP